LTLETNTAIDYECLQVLVYPFERMYIDPKESNKMDQEVNDATAALKGMLGIGGAAAAVPVPPTTPAAAKKEDRGTTTPSPANSEGQANEPKSTKKKRNNNNSNKKKNKAKGALNEGQAGSNEEDQKGKQTIANEGSNTANQTKSASKKNQKKKKNDNKTSENFAWSAFQSSPDASKLPIPAFLPSPADTDRTVVSVEGKGPLPGVVSPSPGPRGASVPVAAPTPVPVVEGTEAAERTIEKEPQDETPEAPVSKTGINLAALTANPPPQSEAPMNSPSTPYMQRPNMMPQHSPGQYNSPPMPPRYPHQNYSNQHHYPPPPPPGYVTVQVQVPPVLMPGRQMVVTSPAGYPVQVIVPDGIPPGFILPVHVPAGPPHMMPPPGQSHYGRQQYYSPNQAH
jgi:hypothetical protein